MTGVGGLPSPKRSSGFAQAGVTTGKARERGIALVIVLWGLVLLAVVAASFATGSRTETILARNLVENAKARALADAGVQRAILELLMPRTTGLIDEGIENLLRLSTESPALARRRIEEDLRRALQAGDLAPEAAEKFREGWRSDGTVYTWRFAGGEVRIAVEDEAGKIDLNRAPDELLRGVFLAVGLDERDSAALVDAIADFRDEDDLKRLSGAEDDDYRAAGLPWGAKDAPFEAVEELQQVMAVTREVYERVAPLVTVYSRRRTIDPATAPREVLLALPGSDAEAVDGHLAARAAAPEGAGPAFVGAEGFTARSRGSAYTIRAEARTASGAVFVRVAVVRLGGTVDRPFQILAWGQGGRAD